MSSSTSSAAGGSSSVGAGRFAAGISGAAAGVGAARGGRGAGFDCGFFAAGGARFAAPDAPGGSAASESPASVAAGFAADLAARFAADLRARFAGFGAAALASSRGVDGADSRGVILQCCSTASAERPVPRRCATAGHLSGPSSPTSVRSSFSSSGVHRRLFVGSAPEVSPPRLGGMGLAGSVVGLSGLGLVG